MAVSDEMVEVVARSIAREEWAGDSEEEKAQHEEKHWRSWVPYAKETLTAALSRRQTSWP